MFDSLQPRLTNTVPGQLAVGELDIFFSGQAGPSFFPLILFINGLRLDHNFVSSNRAGLGPG